jgi:hypothetical protein
MRPPWELLRRKWFEASNKPRTIALIGTMIKDFDNMIAKLDKQIAAEGCTRIRDAENPAYSTLAKVTAKRRENLLVSAAQMKSILDVIGREYQVVTLSVAQSQADPERPATHSAH